MPTTPFLRGLSSTTAMLVIALIRQAPYGALTTRYSVAFMRACRRMRERIDRFRTRVEEMEQNGVGQNRVRELAEREQVQIMKSTLNALSHTIDTIDTLDPNPDEVQKVLNMWHDGLTLKWTLTFEDEPLPSYDEANPTPSRSQGAQGAGQRCL